MKNLYLLIVAFSFVLIGCEKKPPTANEIYEKYEKSIVLIKNSYYLKATVDNGMTFYFVINEDDTPILQKTENLAIQNAGVSFGTGFFISENGEIATNRHVIYPEIDLDRLNIEINNSITSLIITLNQEKIQTTHEMNVLMDFLEEYRFAMTPQDRETVYTKLNELATELDKLEFRIDELTFNPRNTITEVKHLSLGIAFNNTFATDEKDFIECVPKKKSNNTDIDLAIIQLKNKKTPDNVTSFFDIQIIKEGENEINLNDKVFIIGYNNGYYLANTKEGLKSQMTEGNITQEPDGTRLLYSIPTLHGSSGSPVINEWGKLVGVNFAGMSGTQGFNLGVPANALAHLYDDPNYITSNDLEDNEYKSKENKTNYSEVRVSEVLYGYKLGQYAESIASTFKIPIDTILNPTGINYYGYLLEEDTSSYIYFGIKNHRIKSIQLFSLSRNINPTFRDVKMGENKNVTIENLGIPSNVTRNDIGGELLEFTNTNFSVEINQGKLSSIRIWDDPTLFEKPEMEDVPTFENVITIVSKGNNEKISKLFSTELEIDDENETNTVFFEYSWSKEIKYDYSGVYEYFINFINKYKNTENDLTMRLVRGQLPLFVYKFNVPNKIVEIVFKVENGKYLIWEINNYKS